MLKFCQIEALTNRNSGMHPRGGNHEKVKSKMAAGGDADKYDIAMSLHKRMSIATGHQTVVDAKYPYELPGQLASPPLLLRLGVALF